MAEICVKCFRVEKEVWDKFYSIYRKNSHEEIRRLIKEELKRLESIKG